MNQEHETPLDTRAEQAISELKQTIRERYPDASFHVARATDDPKIIHLVTTVDLDDPDEVGDLVLDRVAELVAEEHIPVHVIPVRTPERIKAALAQQASSRRPRPSISAILPAL